MIHALQYHKFVILVQYAHVNNLAVIGILVEDLAVIGILVEDLAVTSILVEDLVLIKFHVEDVTDAEIAYFDFKDILILLVINF